MLEFGWCGRSDLNGGNFSYNVGSSPAVGGECGRESMDSFSFEEVLIATKFCWENLNLLDCIFKSLDIFSLFFFHSVA